MKVLLTLDGRTGSGGTPLLMHNDRLSDPLSEEARALAKMTKKRTKTDADHREVARLEFLGGLYLNGNGPCLPAANILASLQDGAKKRSLGKTIALAVVPLVEHVDLAYTGPRDPDELWKTHHWLRVGVPISGRRVQRTRPKFTDWSAVLPVEVDPEELDPDDLATAWTRAGMAAGIGDWRPSAPRNPGRHGIFLGVATEWKIGEPDDLASLCGELANAIIAQRIQREDTSREARHGLVEDLIKEAQKQRAKLQEHTKKVTQRITT